MPLVFGRSIFGFAVVAGPPAPTWTDPDLTYTSYDSVSFSVAAQDTVPADVFFKSDGTKLYVTGFIGDDVNEYDLSTAWDISSASYVQNFSVAAKETSPRVTFFKPDGTKMYVCGTSSQSVHEYDLTTAWDVSTASFSGSFSLATQESQPSGMFFKDDGTKFFVTAPSSDAVYEYSMSTSWDITTSSYSGNSFSTASQDVTPVGIFFAPDGDYCYVMGQATNFVYEYSLSTAWDASSASYVQGFDASSQNGNSQGLFFKSDGSKMYTVNSNNDAIHQYSTVTPVWTNPDIANASYDSILLGVASQDTLPHDLYIKPNGTKFYITGTSNHAVFEYNMSTAWDLSTGSYSQSFSVNAQETGASGIFFKPDGTKMYITGTSGDDVNEYNLSTAWDVSTASYSQVFSVAAQMNNPRAIFFKDDGTKMFIADQTGPDINEYSLSTGWDVSTASFTRLFSVSSQTTSPQAVYFNPDGTEMFVASSSGDIFEYSLSTGWDLSTASYANIFYDGATTTTGLFFKADGSKMYVLSYSARQISQYST